VIRINPGIQDRDRNASTGDTGALGEIELRGESRKTHRRRFPLTAREKEAPTPLRSLPGVVQLSILNIWVSPDPGNFIIILLSWDQANQVNVLGGNGAEHAQAVSGSETAAIGARAQTHDRLIRTGIVNCVSSIHIIVVSGGCTHWRIAPDITGVIAPVVVSGRRAHGRVAPVVVSGRRTHGRIVPVVPGVVALVITSIVVAGAPIIAGIVVTGVIAGIVVRVVVAGLIASIVFASVVIRNDLDVIVISVILGPGRNGRSAGERDGEDQQ